MIQKGKNRRFRTIRHIIVDSEIAQSVNTFPELNILGSYIFISITFFSQFLFLSKCSGNILAGMGPLASARHHAIGRSGSTQCIYLGK
jgi:hypothetical protein